MDLKTGDKIYKRKNGIADKSKVYEIESITEESQRICHDGYNTIWIASLVGETELFIVKFAIWGEITEIYAEKAIKNE
jgi:hypothetical protein